MSSTSHPDYQKPLFQIIRRALHLLVGMMLLLTGVLAWPLVEAQFSDLHLTGGGRGGALLAAPAVTLTPTLAAEAPLLAQEATALPSATLPPATPLPSHHPALPALEQGITILAMREAGYSHLFLFQPGGNLGSAPFLRLTTGNWDDLTPALSPDGSQVAFASNRDGQWDLYTMQIASGEVARLTDTPAWDASPTWSPDGLWMAYETYDPSGVNGLEIAIRPLQGEGEPILLTDDPGADFAPAWSPQGRLLAFVSNRSGKDEIWLANLDLVEGRFQNIASPASWREDHPSWSQDGTQLAWSALSEDGIESIYSLALSQPDAHPRWVGSGAWAAWSPDGQTLLTAVRTPNQEYLSAYQPASQELALPTLALRGELEGLTWGRGLLPAPLPAVWLAAAESSPAPLYTPALAPSADVPNGRQQVISLGDVEAPTPLLHDLANEAFTALRAQVATQAGWDFLATLENAFVPLTIPVGPGTSEDWLYTGRAFAVNPVAMNAGWLVVVREDFGARAYWRIYLRTRFQDGTQGRPLRQQPWDFSLRYGGDPRFYEQGGGLSTTIPSGYWLDFTALAGAYGFERVPALSTWRTAFSSSRFGEFALMDGLDWLEAMREIYPDAALATATPIPPPTETPTPTLRPTKTPIPTRTPYPTATARPTQTLPATPTLPAPAATQESLP